MDASHAADILSSDARSGARALLLDHMGVERGSRVLLLCHPPLAGFANAVADVARGEGIDCEVGGSNVDFESIEPTLGRFDTVVYLERPGGTASDFPRGTHMREATGWLKSTPAPRTRVFRVFDSSRELLEECFRVPRAELQRLNDALIARAWRTSEIRVTSEAGTDLTVKLDRRYKWTNSCSVFPGRRPGIVPPSEVSTFSEHVDGVLVADGAINCNMTCDVDDPRLAGRPVRVEIADGRATSMQCDDDRIAEFLGAFFAMENTRRGPLGTGEFYATENARRVGEVGLGTNVGIRRFVPMVSFINERVPTLHLGFGAHLQPPGLAYTCHVHLDLILDRCEIAFDGETVLRDGRYLVEETAAPQDLGEIPMIPADSF